MENININKTLLEVLFSKDPCSWNTYKNIDFLKNFGYEVTPLVGEKDKVINWIISKNKRRVFSFSFLGEFQLIYTRDDEGETVPNWSKDFCDIQIFLDYGYVSIIQRDVFSDKIPKTSHRWIPTASGWDFEDDIDRRHEYGGIQLINLSQVYPIRLLYDGEDPFNKIRYYRCPVCKCKYTNRTFNSPDGQTFTCGCGAKLNYVYTKYTEEEYEKLKEEKDKAIAHTMIEMIKEL